MGNATNGSNTDQTIHGGRKALLLGCTAILALTPTSLLAQQAAPATGETVVLEQVVVQGGAGGDDDANSVVATQTTSGGKIATPILETPATISVITAKEIEQRDADTVEEVLQYTAGVNTDFYGSDDRFNFFQIRGFDAFQYRDGLPIGRPFGGVNEEPYAFERVEVLKGASSTTFGVSDPGGAVNYVTKTPKSERFGEVYATGGSFNHGEIGFDLGDNITVDDTLSVRLTGKLKTAEEEYDYSEDDEVFLMGGVTWRPDAATSLTVVFDHLDRDGVPGSGGHPVGTDFDRSRFFGEPDYNYRGTDRDTVSVLFDHDFGTGLSFSSNARYSDSKTDFGYAYISATPTDGSTIARRSFFGSDVATENFVADARLQYDASFENVESRSLVGVEYNDLTSDSDTFFSAAPSIDWANPIYTGAPASVPLYASSHSEQTTKALYVQQDLTFAEKWIASVGLRNDWIDLEQINLLRNTSAENELSEFTKRFGLTYKATEEFATYVSYAESVVPGSSLTVEAERGEQYEFGVKYQPLAFPALFTASIYDLTKNNVTVTDPITALPSTIGEIRVRGLDLEAKAELPRNISVTAAYSYLDAEIIENGVAGNEGKRPQFIPENLASLWLNYELEGSGKRGNMNFGVGGRYVGSYFFSPANTISSDSNVVFDAAFRYDVVENTSLEVNVKNLFDEKHVAYGGFGADFYNPGREITATLRRTW